MEERPLSPPLLNDAIVPSTTNPIREGIIKGAMVALVIAALYALAVPIVLLMMNEALPQLPGADSATNPYLAALIMSGMALLVGGIPALIFGAIGGGIIGAVFRYWVKHRLSSAKALLYGFGMSFSIVVIRLAMLIQGEGIPDGDTLADPLFWIMVMGPMIGAFLGFWWVAYQVNTKMPPKVGVNVYG